MGPVLYLFVVQVLMVCSLGAHLQAQPYADPFLNGVEGLTLSVGVLTPTFALIVNTRNWVLEEWIAVAVLNMLMMTCIFTFFGLVVALFYAAKHKLPSRQYCDASHDGT